LVFYRENFSRKACSPTKLGELMGVGIPSICSPNVGDTSDIVISCESGVVLKGLNAAGYRHAVKQIEQLLEKDPESIREGAFRYFDLSDGIEKYSAVYSKILS